MIMRFDITEIVIMMLLVVAIALLGYIVAYSIDQSLAKPEFAGISHVESKDSGTRTTLLPAGKVLIPITRPYWSVTYVIENYRVTSDVSQACFQTLAVGQEIQVYERRGIFSTNYYPAC